MGPCDSEVFRSMWGSLQTNPNGRELKEAVFQTFLAKRSILQK